MRKLLLRVGLLLGLPLALSGCTDAVTLPQADAPAPSLTTAVEADSGDYQDPSCCEKVIVIVPGPDPAECDPYTSLNWCDGGGDCMTTQPSHGDDPELMTPNAGSTGCAGGGGGPVPPPPPPTTEPLPSDTCRTGEPALDAPAVKAGLKDLWDRSNPNAPQAQRLEQGAWIVQNADGSYGMAPFATSLQGPCNINGNYNPPPNAIAWVHTHPFTAGETMTICGAYKTRDPATGAWRDIIGPDGRPVYPVYNNRPSIDDHGTMADMNETLAMNGRDILMGVVIDHQQTSIYNESTAAGYTIRSRCGY